MKLLFAIGNPGPKYEKTYHNLGILFANFLKTKFSVQKSVQKEKYNLLEFENFSILISNVYMNCSAQALLPVLNFYKFKPENILVAHDELGIKKYRIRIKLDQGNGGHNGLRDISAHIKNFPRLQFGIDHPKNFNPHLDVSDYVLSTIDDLQKWQDAFEKEGLPVFLNWLNPTP
jgi:PTH1 family peptidyl-tRNA hydrolase